MAQVVRDGANQLTGLKWAEGMIADKAARREYASSEFRADDADKSGALDREEVTKCMTRICKKFGLALPRHEKVIELLDLCDKVRPLWMLGAGPDVVCFRATLTQRSLGRTVTASFRSRSFVRRRQLKPWTPKPPRSRMPCTTVVAPPLTPDTLNLTPTLTPTPTPRLKLEIRVE